MKNNRETLQDEATEIKRSWSGRQPGHGRTAMMELAFGLSLLLGPLYGPAQEIACGQIISNTIGSAEQTISYTFEANAGETFDILALGQNFNATADVEDPSGNRFGSCTNSFT